MNKFPICLQRWSELLFYIVIGTMIGIFLLFTGSCIAMCGLNSSRPRFNDIDIQSKNYNQETGDNFSDTEQRKQWANGQTECPAPSSNQFTGCNYEATVEEMDMDNAFPTPPEPSNWETIELNQVTNPRT